MITLIDYGAGNLHSLQGALTRLGFQSVRAVTPADAPGSGALVLPGVGHFTAARAALVERGWWDVLPPLVAAGRPLLGICLGLQLLAEASEESPGATGLGLVPGVSRLLGPGVKVPNMGWAKVQAMSAHPALPDFREDWLYFVHSYALDTDAAQRDAGLTIERKPMPAHWDWPLDAPVSVKVPVRAFDWKPSEIAALPDQPVAGAAAETVRLVPYGCTKFRISMFPVTPRAWPTEVPKR